MMSLIRPQGAHVPYRTLLLLSLVLGPSVAADPADRTCNNELFVIDARFEGGDLDKCKFKSRDSVELTFRPEDYKVDDAFAWFSFKVTATVPRDLTIKLRFPDAYARYWPKISNDGQSWEPAGEDRVTRGRKGKSMTLSVAVDEDGTWVSAQELVTLAFYKEWLEELNAHGEILTAVIGQSVEGRPIHLAKTANKREAIVLLGRQHPAEVPGALTMRDFVDVVIGDTELAQRFRERFTLLIVPLVNPDGVVNGHSRHNSGRVDLNRDWGSFTQPETQSIGRLLAGVDKLGMKPRLMFDFHATKMTPTMIFYTQIDEDVTDPVNFANDWLGNVRERIPDYEFIHDPRPVSDQANTKVYFYRRYGIPSITYEVGDEADREKVREHAPVFAEEMMKVLLASD